MNKPTVRTVSRLHTAMRVYSVAEVDAYIAHLEQRTEAAEAYAASLSDIIDSRESDLRAAEAKLAELEKQEPVGETVNIGGAVMVEWGRCISDGTQLFTRPAPAINLGELVPINAPIEVIENMDEVLNVHVCDSDMQAVWSVCRTAILRKIEEAK